MLRRIRRSFISFCRRKKRGRSDELRARKHTTIPAVAAVEHDHDRKQVASIRHDDDGADKTEVVYVPQTVFCLVKDDAAKVSKHDQDEANSILATIATQNQVETASIAKSRRDMLHQAYEDYDNSVIGEKGKIGTVSWIDRVPYSSGSTVHERKTKKRVSLAHAHQWDLFSGISTRIYSPTYTEATDETTSTMTSKEGGDCVGATVDELGAVIINEMFPMRRKRTSRHKGEIPPVISIGHQPVVMTPDTLLLGCFNPVQTAIDVGAAIDLVASRTFVTKHRQLENVIRPVNNRTSRKRELRTRNSIEMCNADVSGGLDSFVMLSPATTAGLNDPIKTLMENSIELAAPQTFSFNTKHRQLQEASRFHSRQRQLRGVRDSGFTKQYAARGVDGSKAVKAKTLQPEGLHTRRPPASIVPFSQCAVLEATKSMTEESKDEFAFRNPHYAYMPGSVTAQSRW
jgi:hypothetical protein